MVSREPRNDNEGVYGNIRRGGVTKTQRETTQLQQKRGLFCGFLGYAAGPRPVFVDNKLTCYYTSDMPITQSAKKALRQSLKRHAQNLKRKGAYKKLVKNVKRATAAGKIEEAKKLLPQFYKSLDKAAKTNVIKKNKASRLKSRITKLVQKSTKS